MNFDLLLQNIAKHIQLDKTESDFFISLLEFKTIKRKDYLLRQGEICKTENFIIKGCLRGIQRHNRLLSQCKHLYG